MTAPRRAPGLKTKLAAALCALTDSGGARIIPHEHAKAMSEDNVLSLFQWDHYPIRHEAGGPAEHWNLDPRLIKAHAFKTAKVDIPQAAKVKRVIPAERAHRAVMAAKVGIDPEAPARPSRRKAKIHSGPFQQGHRPFRGQNNLRKRK